MRVLLTGGTGFIGGHLLRALLSAGHQVQVVARRPGPPLPGVTWITGDFSRSLDPAAWADAVRGVDAVVNAVGIIREAPGQRFVDLHERAPTALFTAAHAAGVRRLVQLSALGADDHSPEPYFRTRRVADRAVLALGGIVLRPSFVWGPGDLSFRFFRSLAALPVVPVVGDGSYRVQPVHVEDLVRALLAAVEGGAPGEWDVGGDEVVSFRELLGVLRARMGRRPAWFVPVPLGLVRLGAAVTAATGLGPITPDELSMLLRGSTCDLTPFRARFGFSPRGLRAGLALQPGAAREALVAEIDALVPVLRVAVGFIWLVTPWATWVATPRADALALLADAGFTGPLAAPLLDATCALELLVGIATIAGWRLAWVGALQLLLVLGFSAILLVSGSPLWGHPFGPLTKNIPLMAAILAVIATRDRGAR